MMRGWWPEFNWLSNPNVSYERVYSKLFNDVSRVLYTDKGEILSIMRPQLGKCIKHSDA